MVLVLSVFHIFQLFLCLALCLCLGPLVLPFLFILLSSNIQISIGLLWLFPDVPSACALLLPCVFLCCCSSLGYVFVWMSSSRFGLLSAFIILP